MKKNIIIAATIYFTALASQNIYAQSISPSGIKRCGTAEYIALKKQQDSTLESRMAKAESDIQAWLKNPPPTAKTVITIPVVVHVVYKTSEQNIPEQYIHQLIAQLNKDYGKQNSDWNNTPDAFKPLVADCEIDFCLASKDTNNNPTTGILKIPTIINDFSSTDEFVKYTALGGSDIWDHTKYLNLWICNVRGGILGYAPRPVNGFDKPQEDGVVLHYKALPGPAAYPAYNKGRTATHEIGHWLDLIHPWGDDTNSDGICDSNDGPGKCSGDDMISDTPNQ